MLSKKSLILLFLIVINSKMFASSDDKKIVFKIDSIVTNVIEDQALFLKDTVAQKNSFSSINKIYKSRKSGYRDIKKWFISSLTSIYYKESTLTIEELERLRERRLHIVDSSFNNSIEFFYNLKKYDGFRIFPVYSAYMCMLYYNDLEKINFFQNTNLGIGDNSGSFKSDIISGYLGIFKISFSSVLSKLHTEKITQDQLNGLTEIQMDSLIAATDSVNKSKATLNKLISGGGEANLSFKTPFINCWGNYKNHVKFKTDIVINFCGEVPVAGNDIPKDKINFFGSFGLENKLIIPVLDFDMSKKEGFEAFAFFGQYNIYAVKGSNSFYSNIGIKNRPLLFSEYSFGFAYKYYCIYYSNQIFFDSELSKMSYGRLSVALIKQF